MQSLRNFNSAMENEEEILYREMRNLIALSCLFNKLPSAEFYKFHRTFLIYFFNVVDVNIDYETKMISIWNTKPLPANPVRLFDLNEAVAAKVSYSDLEETLMGCLKEGQLQNDFYKRLLFKFGQNPIDEGDSLSA